LMRDPIAINERIKRRDEEAFSTVEPMFAVSPGPLLDNTDFALVKSFTRRGNDLELTVVHTSARQAGMRLMRNIPWQPVVFAPTDLPAGDYTMKVKWIALETLPDGKPHAKQAEPQGIQFTVLDKATEINQARFSIHTPRVWFIPETGKTDLEVTLRIKNTSEKEQMFLMMDTFSLLLKTPDGKTQTIMPGPRNATRFVEPFKLKAGESRDMVITAALALDGDNLRLDVNDPTGAVRSSTPFPPGALEVAFKYQAEMEQKGNWWVGAAQTKPLRVELIPADAKRLEKCPIVIRAQRMGAGEGSKYIAETVRVTSVLKNITTHTIGETMSVRYLGGEKILPGGEVTLYLEHDGRNGATWTLLSAKTTDGVSHRDAKPRSAPNAPTPEF
jgi:hypothetical protein